MRAADPRVREFECERRAIAVVIASGLMFAFLRTGGAWPEAWQVGFFVAHLALFATAAVLALLVLLPEDLWERGPWASRERAQILFWAIAVFVFGIVLLCVWLSVMSVDNLIRDPFGFNQL